MSFNKIYILFKYQRNFTNTIYINNFDIMDPTAASFKRYWEPNFFQTLGLSLATGAIATSITHPI